MNSFGSPSHKTIRTNKYYDTWSYTKFLIPLVVSIYKIKVVIATNAICIHIQFKLIWNTFCCIISCHIFTSYQQDKVLPKTSSVAIFVPLWCSSIIWQARVTDRPDQFHGSSYNQFFHLKQLLLIDSSILVLPSMHSSRWSLILNADLILWMKA